MIPLLCGTTCLVRDRVILGGRYFGVGVRSTRATRRVHFPPRAVRSRVAERSITLIGLALARKTIAPIPAAWRVNRARGNDDHGSHPEYSKLILLFPHH